MLTPPFEKFARAYRKSEVIFAEESAGSEMYIIRSGQVSISKATPEGEVMLTTLGPGEFFGEMALCDASPRSATAIAAEDDTVLLALDQDKFLYLVGQQPVFVLTIMHTLCQRIRGGNILYSDLVKGTTESLEPEVANDRARQGD